MMFSLPNSTIKTMNKQNYLKALCELRNQLGTQESYNLNRNNSLELVKKLPFCHQLKSTKGGNYEVLENILETGYLFSNSSLKAEGIDASTFTIGLDREFGRDKHLYFSLGRARAPRPSSSIYLLFDKSSLNYSPTNGFFSDDLARFQGKYPNPKGDDLAYIWNEFFDYVLTIDDGIEIMGEFIASRFENLEEFFYERLSFHNISFFRNFMPEFVLFEERIPIQSVSQIVHVYQEKLDVEYNNKLKSLINDTKTKIPFCTVELSNYYKLFN